MLELLESLPQTIWRGAKKVIGLLYSQCLAFYRRLQSLVTGDTYIASATALELLFPNLQIEWKKSTFMCQAGDRGFAFGFQGGHFVAVSQPQKAMVSFYYPALASRPLGRLVAVRHACNEFNSLGVGNFSAYYTIEPETHEVFISLRFGLPIRAHREPEQKELAEHLEKSFSYARWIDSTLNTIEAEDDNNLEENAAISSRLNYLAHTVEMKHNPGLPNWHEGQEHHHTVGDIFATFYEQSHRVRLLRLDGVFAGGENGEESKPLPLELHDEKEIAELSLVQCLMMWGTTHEELSGRALTLVIGVDIEGFGRHDCLLHVACESETEHELFFRVTFTRPVAPVSPRHSAVNTNAEQQSCAVSFVVAYDKTSAEQREKEFDYRWKEAEDAAAHGEELTEEQDEMLACKTPYYGFCMYWGRRFYASERYFEALDYFLNVYHWLSPMFNYMNKTQRGHFFDLVFYIGSCYNGLELYPLAYYYLDALYIIYKPRYCKAYVNALVNGHDFRALYVIDRFLEQSAKESEGENPESSEEKERQAYVRFLKRRRGTALADCGMLDEAEAQFQALLEHPDCEDTAIEELLRIQQIRNEKEENSQSTNS